ncbi:winged helix-turn-helix domain-containing protein [Streptomyces sp. NPDC056361]|uniref:winged helix-turn-helix domain-containing protein n=1 Tax=Streptomyces sp. NPDC056361 TaxID=3345795 RepID=UPI0035E081D0
MVDASPRGTYLLIAEAIRHEITLEKLTDTLPSEAALMRAHNVSRNTIRRALKSLEGKGIVESSPGIGWRVADGSDRRTLVDRLTELISEEDLEIGDTYPSEAQLCERFSSSRTAVRRALAQMEGIGLLSTVHGKGRYVRALPASPGQP